MLLLVHLFLFRNTNKIKHQTIIYMIEKAMRLGLLSEALNRDTEAKEENIYLSLSQSF